MSRFISRVVLVLVLCCFHYSTGYKWITLKSNDTIPTYALKLNDKPNNRYIGRAIHYNLVLPAEVYNSTYALVSYDFKEIVKKQFEILVATEPCEWKQFGFIRTIPDNVVRAGTAWNNEPIYIGSTMYRDNNHIASILIGSNRYDTWEPVYNDVLGLTCNDNTTNWVEASSGNIPNNTVLGGQTSNSTSYFVGRLLGAVSWIPGEVIPSQNSTTARHRGHDMQSVYCQVLVGNATQYQWTAASNGKIPDYAVVGGQSENGEMRYVARISNSSTYILASEATGRSYDILVKNV